jgi:hypothetical protein
MPAHKLRFLLRYRKPSPLVAAQQRRRIATHATVQRSGF